MSEKTNVAIYIDPPSYHFLKDQLFNVHDGRLNGDNILAPYVHLRNFFTAHGIPVHTADYMPKENGNTRNIYVSMGRLKNYRKIFQRQDTTLSAFFAMECPIVEPSLYQELNQAQHYFKRIFSWSDGLSLERFIGRRLQLEPFHWPQSFNKVHETIWNQEDRQFLVMINTNKLPAIYWQELYTERLRAVEFFSRTKEIDLYGRGWDGPPYKLGKTLIPATIRRMQRYLAHQWSRVRPDLQLLAARQVYCGSATSKIETLGQYTFAISFENMILKGWITEKIFDCFFAGTIPIYWGSPNIEDHVPTNCFIDMREFPDYTDLRAFLKSLNKKDIRRYKDNAVSYLASEDFTPFKKESFTELFKRIVTEDTGILF